MFVLSCSNCLNKMIVPVENTRSKQKFVNLVLMKH